MPQTPPPVDWASFDQLIDEVGPAVMPRLLETFYGEARTRIAAFERLSQAASPTGEGGALHREVHSLKSAAGSFGALALTQAAADLEVEIETGRYRHDPAAIQNLSRLFGGFVDAVTGRGAKTSG